VTSLLTSSTVALLAHRRLADTSLALRQKLRSDFVDDLVVGQSRVVKNDPERWVSSLATAAVTAFEGGPSADGPKSLPVGPGVRNGIGTFAILGSAAFELPAYADLLAPGGTWVADALRRGSPDPNLSHVVVGTTQLAVRTAELARARTRDDDEKELINGFAMGMLSSVACAVTVGPVLRGLQARRSKREWTRHAPAVDIAAVEARILRNVLPVPDAARVWQGWWPPSHKVPDALYDGYVAALEEAYHLETNRPHGFAEFERTFSAGDAMTAARLREAYAFLRSDASTADWGWKGWWLVLGLGTLVTPLGLLIANELPAAHHFFTGDALDERAFWELAVLGLGLGTVAPIAWTIWLTAMIPEHRRALVTAFVLGGLRGLGAYLGLRHLADSSARARWLGVVLPLAATDAFAIYQSRKAAGEGRQGDKFLFGLQATASANALLLVFVAFVMKKLGVGIRLALLLTTVALALLSIPFARAIANRGGIRWLFLRDLPDGLPLLGSLGAAANPPSPAAVADVFDDSTLWHEAGVAAPTLADLRYPSGPRPLVRLWWTGAGDLDVRADDHTITFRPGGGNPTDVQVPLTGATPMDLVARLKQAVPGLEAEAVDTPATTYDMPFPRSFSDPGDSQPTLAEHDLHREDFVRVGTSRDQAHLVLHAPRVELVTSAGLEGPVVSAVDDISVVPSRALGDVEESALGLAADLAVLLCLGAMPSLSDSPIHLAAPAPTLDPVFQLFREWNLDERRVNEWRMLVTGGADSEKQFGAPDQRDPAMRPNPVAGAPAYASKVPAGERIATAMGWIPLWRAWLRMAADPLSDTTAAVSMPYTPVVATRDGHEFKPTNADLSAGVRFLLDLP
jgi:hypothetical protein